MAQDLKVDQILESIEPIGSIKSVSFYKPEPIDSIIHILQS